MCKSYCLDKFMIGLFFFFFFFSSRRRHTRLVSDWSSDVCSSDLNANPTSVLITPIKTDKAIEGVLELAFFHKLESHHFDFIEKLCTNIAATLSSTKINERTQNLLEQSQIGRASCRERV